MHSRRDRWLEKLLCSGRSPFGSGALYVVLEHRLAVSRRRAVSAPILQLLEVRALHFGEQIVESEEHDVENDAILLSLRVRAQCFEFPYALGFKIVANFLQLIRHVG